MSLILASSSQIRREMLKQAGIIFDVRPPRFDEDQVKQTGRKADELARQLAEGKATSTVADPDDWVIGSDSTVSVNGVRYSKPTNRRQATAHLRAFSDQTMVLSSAVALAKDGVIDWSHAETARLRIRPLSDRFIEQYLDLEWPDVGACVGVFRMEGRGVTLFEEVEGSHFTILGMPLHSTPWRPASEGNDAVMTPAPTSTKVGAGYAEVIGDPIDHSLSPLIHGFWLEALGLKASYSRRKVSRAELPAYLAEKRTDADWLGSNVTMPLKLDAVALADGAADWAVAAGAANVLMMREGKLIAANTDVGAIATLLSRLHQAKARMGSVVLLGNGGSARAALVALKLVGITNVRIQARDLAKATKLAVEFGLDVEPVLFTAPITGDGLINATPLGMAGRDCLNCDLDRMSDQGWVFDMVYDPAETPLIVAARSRGLHTVDGLGMLVEQAATSFKLFFGQEAPRDRDAELWHKLKP